MNVSNNINSAIVSGTLGIQNASDAITNSASNLASLSVQDTSSSTPQEFLANATVTQLSNVKQLLPETTSGITSDLVGLSVSANNAEASAKVLDVANGTVGTLLDIFA
ncbi:hypothetical protein [Paraglaciecola sp. 2405UD69-4]|uniref:hypothetical protein n=1 Tax=Paraglaciecola sp. 2405UD69-4 TaxID=3391836 RepID=UPI0039C9AAEA